MRLLSTFTIERTFEKKSMSWDDVLKFVLKKKRERWMSWDGVLKFGFEPAFKSTRTPFSEPVSAAPV